MLHAGEGSSCQGGCRGIPELSLRADRLGGETRFAVGLARGMAGFLSDAAHTLASPVGAILSSITPVVLSTAPAQSMTPDALCATSS